MSLETQLSTDKTVLTIHMEEKFDFGKVQDFRDAYLHAPEQVNTLVVDLAETEYMDSSALGMLLNMQKTMMDRIEHFKIVHCRPQVAKILKISRFDKKFELTT